jgi:hypothetical protein
MSKILPQAPTPEMLAQGDTILNAVGDINALAATKPATYGGVKIARMQEDAIDLAKVLKNSEATAYDRYVAVDSFKQRLQKLKRWDGGVEAEAAELIGDLHRKVLTSLEDGSIWGAAGERQKEINKAVSEYLKSLKGFRGAVATKVGPNEYVINPDKVQTLINQVNKGKAGIKQENLATFLDATDNLYGTLERIDQRLGLNSLVDKPATTASRAVTQKLTPGMKAADFLSAQAINTASEAGGLELGYMLGKATGLPGADWIGPLFGHYAIKPILKTVMPVMAKPITGIAASAPGFRAASQAITAVVNGENMSKLAADALFLSDKKIPISKVATKDKEKLDKKIREIQSNPESILELNKDLNHYLPDHGTVLADMTMNALSYLAQKRPEPKQNSPLDKPIKPRPQQMNQYLRTLEIADDPLVIVKRIKEGTLKSSDVIDLKTMYPYVYQDLSEKISMAMMDHISKGGTINAKVKKGLSLFTATPLDSTLTPQAIQAAQATYLQQGQAPEQQMPQMAPKSSRKSQLPTQAQTDQQRRILKQ